MKINSTILLFFLVSCSSVYKTNSPETDLRSRILEFKKTAIMDTITVVINGQVSSLCTNIAVHAVIQLTGKEQIYRAQSDKEGAFQFNHIQAGQYKISTSSVGHHKIDSLIQLGPGDVWHLKIVLGCEFSQ